MAVITIEVYVPNYSVEELKEAAHEGNGELEDIDAKDVLTEIFAGYSEIDHFVLSSKMTDDLPERLPT